MADLSARATAPPEPNTKHTCSVPGCKRLTMRGSGDGLSFTYCRPHVQFIARHGSTWRKSLTPQELEPFRKAAEAWLNANATSPFVRMAEEEMTSLLNESGPVVFAGLLRDETADGRARQALARLRDAGKPALSVVREVLATKLALRGLDGIPRDDDYHLCQIGKRVHRMAPGYKWDLTLPDGTKRKKQWNPEPRGQMLRQLAAMVLGVTSRAFSESDLKAMERLTTRPRRAA